jgi:hypothetical protein
VKTLSPFKRLTQGLLISLTALSALSARAEKMDLSTHTMVIEQIETALHDMDQNDPSRGPVLLRLGDLYSERARLDALDEVSKDCKQDCFSSSKDRRTSIRYYEQGLPLAGRDLKGKVLIQLAHLHEILGEKKPAEDIYRKIIKGKKGEYDPEVLGLAYSGRGEIEFARNDFKNARQDFKNSLRLANPARKGYVTYRIAWCDLNLGNLDQAIAGLTKILKNKDLLLHESTEGAVIDTSFQSDVARDLATFYARGEVTEKTVRTLVELSPNKKENLVYLANELERLGNKKSAMLVWGVYVRDEKGSTAEKIAAHLRSAQDEFDTGSKAKVISELNQAADIWKKSGCSDKAVCEGLQSQFKKFVADWSRSQKKNPTPELFQAYSIYVSLFQDDAEMHYRSAQLARDLKMYKQSSDEFQKAAILAQNSKDKSVSQVFEPALLAEIEMAELSKDPAAREAAYLNYLKMNPNGAKSLDVRYQRAHIFYERTQYKEAADAFHDVALHPGAKLDFEIQTKAADLALDSTVFLKNDVQLETWAGEFALAFPKRSADYNKISRKAALNQVASTTNNGQSSNSELEKALAKLDHVDLRGSSTSEQIAFYKNKINLAQKVQNIDASEKAGIAMERIKGLSNGDREFALTAQVWSAEMSYDFTKAFRISQKMKFPKLSTEERLLRLAMLAELSGHNPRPFQDQYLKTTRNSEKAAIMRAKIVRTASSPERELHKQLPYLKNQPDLVANLSIESFARTHDYREASQILKNSRVRNTSAGRILARTVFLREFDVKSLQLSHQRLNTKSDSRLQKTLAERISLLKQNEALAQQAIRTHDWTLQVLTLSNLSAQNQRLYSDIMNLPVPRGLKPAQKAQYGQLVAAKARPFQMQAEKIQSKVTELWQHSQELDQLIEDYNSVSSHTNSRLKNVIALQLNALKNHAPAGSAQRLEQVLSSSSESEPSNRDVQNALAQAKQRPFNVADMQKLKDLEEKRGSDTMAAYLDARMSRLQAGQSTQAGMKQ